ncbi:helix-turn-helix domain-containing protein, partial [Listeria monocytogenes]|nr:helix-turn-helix domain-containing protein [Listeria monocytogenes]
MTSRLGHGGASNQAHLVPPGAGGPSRAELARFLRDRRARRRPVDDGPRRTPGLRREEVAGRASMSVEYYTRLEQGRG